MSYIGSWEELENSVKICTKCPLHRYRRNAVLGEGSRSSPVMLVGEAPGATEDEMGRPFVGAAGRLLTLALESVGIDRNNVYITNVVKCRPPQNREPKDEEIESCSIYLESQILLLKPKIIVALGNVAGKKVFSLGSRQWDGVTRARGRVHQMTVLGLRVHVVPTIHPAAALYNPALRSVLLEDLKHVKELLASVAAEGANEAKRESRTLIDYIKREAGIRSS